MTIYLHSHWLITASAIKNRNDVKIYCSYLVRSGTFWDKKYIIELRIIPPLDFEFLLMLTNLFIYCRALIACCRLLGSFLISFKSCVNSVFEITLQLSINKNVKQKSVLISNEVTRSCMSSVSMCTKNLFKIQ